MPGKCLAVLIISAIYIIFPYELPAQAGFEYAELSAQARQARLRGDYEKAIGLYAALLETNPEDTDALVGRAYALMAAGAGREAVSDFERAIDLAPDYTDAYIGLVILQKRGVYDADPLRLIDDCLAALNNDSVKIRYLAKACWQEQLFEPARRLDKEFPPEKDRILVPEPNRLELFSTVDRLTIDETWISEQLTYSRAVRPDLSWRAGLGRYRRYDVIDTELACGLTWRKTRTGSILSELYLSDADDFLADRKVRLLGEFGLARSVSMGLGADLSWYDGDDARIGRVTLTKYWNQTWGKYTLLSGIDNNDIKVSTTILEWGLDKEMNYSLRLGIAFGNESIEEGGGTSFSEDRIDTLFGSWRYYGSEAWGFILSGAYEWRDKRLFRRTAGAGLFWRY